MTDLTTLTPYKKAESKKDIIIRQQKKQLTKAKEYLEQTLPYLENIDEEGDELYDKINGFIKEIEK
jgi:hypothetical protein